MSVRKKFNSLFALDYRSLAFFRISISCVLLADLYVRAFDITAHYTDLGVLPRAEAIKGLVGAEFFVSLHLITGSVVGQALLFCMAAFFIIGMLLGVRTKWCTIISWMLLCSLHTRNPYVIHSGDYLLRMMVFWSLFVPTAKVWSVDALRMSTLKGERPETTVASMGTVAFVCQLAIVYIVAVHLKTSPIWTEDYTALYYALRLDQMVTPLGVALSQHFVLCKGLTFVTLLIQKYGLFLLLIPVSNSLCRVIAIVLFCSFHIGSGLTFSLGLFLYTSVISWLTLTPSEVWNMLENNEFILGLKSYFKGIFSKDFFRWFYPVKEPIYPIKIRQGTQNIVISLLLVYVILWNVQTAQPTYRRHLEVFPRSVSWIGYALRLDQHWNMFAPAPTTQDGWYILLATKRNGLQIDLLTNGAEVSWDKPPIVSQMYKNIKWQTYMLYLSYTKYSSYLPYYGSYLMRQWNETHEGDQSIKSLEIVFMQEITSAPGAPYNPPEKRSLWKGEI